MSTHDLVSQSLSRAAPNTPLHLWTSLVAMLRLVIFICLCLLSALAVQIRTEPVALPSSAIAPRQASREQVVQRMQKRALQGKRQSTPSNGIYPLCANSAAEGTGQKYALLLNLGLNVSLEYERP